VEVVDNHAVEERADLTLNVRLTDSILREKGRPPTKPRAPFVVSFLGIYAGYPREEDQEAQ